MDSSEPSQLSESISDIETVGGREIFSKLKKAYEWKDKYDHPSQEFLSLVESLFVECQLHLTDISSKDGIEFRREADTIVQEIVAVRNHLGPGLLILNSFVRESIPITFSTTSQLRQFKVVCAQYFEPVPFYDNHPPKNSSQLMKLYHFSVYDLQRKEVILHYYLERSNFIRLYHVLCFTCGNSRGQIHPYGTEEPPYWDIRRDMMEDVNSRLLHAMSPGIHAPPESLVITKFLQPQKEAHPLPVTDVYGKDERVSLCVRVCACIALCMLCVVTEEK